VNTVVVATKDGATVIQKFILTWASFPIAHTKAPTENSHPGSYFTNLVSALSSLDYDLNNAKQNQVIQFVVGVCACVCNNRKPTYVTSAAVANRLCLMLARHCWQWSRFRNQELEEDSFDPCLLRSMFVSHFKSYHSIWQFALSTWHPAKRHVSAFGNEGRRTYVVCSVFINIDHFGEKLSFRIALPVTMYQIEKSLDCRGILVFKIMWSHFENDTLSLTADADKF